MRVSVEVFALTLIL